MDGDSENVSAATISVSTACKDTKGKSHISIEEFLNFLKTAYQVNHITYCLLFLAKIAHVTTQN